MRTKRAKTLAIAGGVIVLIAVAASIVILSFDVNSYKSKIESAASEATGLNVKINGRIGLSFFPFGVSAKDIHAAARGGEILILEQLKLGAELLPLLKKQLKVTSCVLVRPAIIIVKDPQGKYNFEGGQKTRTTGLPGAAFTLKDLKLSGGTFVYVDAKTGEKTEVRDITLAIRDLTVADISKEIVKNISFTVNVDCKEILRKGLKIENLKASAKTTKGLYSVQPLTIGSLVYSDAKTGEKTEVRDVTLAIRDLTVADISKEIVKNVSFTGNVDCKEILRKDLKIESMKSPLKAEKGVFQLKPFTMYMLGAQGKGDFAADMSEADAAYRINLRMPKLDFEKLQESVGVRRVVGGKVDLVASLTVKEKRGRDILKSIYGALSLRGNNLVTYTVDLDKVLSAFAASRKFSLLDIGAFFITGPLGSAALKGYRYGDLYYQTQGGRGTITKFVSRWKIRNGVADATDCALATRHNRVALKGRINFVEERYDNVVVALLDDQGCAKFKQGISGPFGSPQVGAIDVVESLAAPLMNLFKETRRFVQGRRCQVFYKGSIRPPR